MVLRVASTQEVLVRSVRHKTVPALVRVLGVNVSSVFPAKVQEQRRTNLVRRQPGPNNRPDGWRAVLISARSRQSRHFCVAKSIPQFLASLCLEKIGFPVVVRR